MEYSYPPSESEIRPNEFEPAIAPSIPLTEAQQVHHQQLLEQQQQLHQQPPQIQGQIPQQQQSQQIQSQASGSAGSASAAWTKKPGARWALISLLLTLIVVSVYFIRKNSTNSTSTNTSGTYLTGAYATGAYPTGSYPTARPVTTTTNTPNSGGRKPSIQTPYGLLTGNFFSDTQIILPIGSVVTIYSPYSKGFLRMVNANEATSSSDTIAAGGAVIQADGKSATEASSQWIVKPPFRYKGAVRLDCVAYDALYLSQSSPKGDTNKVVIMPGVGVEWSDFIATTANFVDTKFTSESKSAIFIGVETAVLNDIDSIVPETRFLMGTNANGTLPDTSKVITGLSAFWTVNIIGSVDADGTISYN